MYEIGVSGSRHGTTKKQLDGVFELLLALPEEEQIRVHEGCCKGFDDQLVESLALAPRRYYVCGHPPKNSSKRVVAKWPHYHDTTMVEDEYLGRDDKIIEHGTDFIVAAPYTLRYVRGSGTWYVIKHAVAARRKVRVVHRDGEVLPGQEALKRR